MADQARRKVSAREFFIKLYREWTEDSVADTAAALTYWGILALFPFLLFLVAIASLVLEPNVTGNLISMFGRFAPAQATQILSDRLTSLQQNRSSGLLSVGFVLALWSASGGMSSLMQALNRCYDVVETRPYWKKRLIAIALTLVAGILSIVAAGVLFVTPVVGNLLGGRLGTLVTWIRYPTAGAVMLAVWALLYWLLPNVKPKFQLITPGTLIGVALWLVASYGFSEYVRHSTSYETTYGAIGGVIVMLVWMWISSVVILLGAEINKILTPQERLQHAMTGEKTLGAKEQPPVATPREPQPA